MLHYEKVNEGPPHGSWLGADRPCEDLNGRQWHRAGCHQTQQLQTDFGLTAAKAKADNRNDTEAASPAPVWSRAHDCIGAMLEHDKALYAET